MFEWLGQTTSIPVPNWLMVLGGAALWLSCLVDFVTIILRWLQYRQGEEVGDE